MSAINNMMKKQKKFKKETGVVSLIGRAVFVLQYECAPL